VKKIFFSFFICGCFFLFAEERPLYESTFNPKSTGIFLPVKIGEKECKFLFDTGASFVVLDKGMVPLLGDALSLREAQARIGVELTNNRIITPNGELDLLLYKAIPMKLGRLQVANRFPYMTADLQALWSFSGEQFCGILGMSFLHQFRWEIDFKKGKLKAYIGAEPYMGEYNTRSPIFWSSSHIPQVNVNLNGKDVGFDIDLGDNGTGRLLKETLVFLEQNSQVLAKHEQTIITVSDQSQSEEVRLKYLRFSDVIYPHVIMQVSQQNALGRGFFKRHKLVLDFPFNMLYLQHYEGYNAADEIDKSGIRVILKEGKLIVFDIKPLSGAIVENLHKGDEIVMVNGKKGLSIFELRALLRGDEGEELLLTTKREEKIFTSRVLLGKAEI